VVLYSSVFILPLHRDWIYHPRKYEQELQSFLCTPTRTTLESPELKHFMECLKWKDSQRLVFWMRNATGSPLQSSGDEVHPFWKEVSSTLSSVYDPITGDQYNALRLDAAWWNGLEVSKYDTKISLILQEIQCLTMRFDTIQEILYQSNPQSLNPVITFSGDGNDCSSQDSPSGVPSFEICRMESFDDHSKGAGGGDGDEEHHEDGGLWFIVEDYDDHDPDTGDSPLENE